MSDSPVQDIETQLKDLRKLVDGYRMQEWGDRNDVEAFKATLRGRIELLEASAAKLVTLEQHAKLEETVLTVAAAVNRAGNILNKGITAVLLSALGAAGLWLFQRLTGGAG